MSTHQQVFDRIATHLLTQKGKSIDHETCVYRGVIKSGPNEGKVGGCAIGGVLSDEHAEYLDRIGYSTFHEGEEGEKILDALGLTGDDYRDYALLSALQAVHDHASVGFWPTQLRSCASQFNLDPSVVNEYE